MSKGLSIRDAEDAALGAQAEQLQWQDEFMRQWYMPMAQVMLSMLVRSIDPQQRALLEQAQPGVFEAMDRVIEGGHNGR